MAKADIHVHSKYSEHSSDWFLKRIGANESYIDPVENYKLAKQSGMTFVTITDHNRIDGSLILKNMYPDDAFTGVELTTYFPEDRCKIHILVYGFSENEFTEMNSIRENIYLLREYIKVKNLAYSVAHATWSINNKLTIEHLEKLILLFDVFEGINGHRDVINNNSWIEILNNLTPLHLQQMEEKHGIAPISSDPWIKGTTGGGDDHAGIYVGKVYTEADAETPQEYVEKLKDKRAVSASGEVNNYKQFAFNIYKIACDYSKTKGLSSGGSILGELNSLLFTNSAMGIKNRLKLYTLRNKGKKQKDKLKKVYYELISLISGLKNLSVNEKFDIIYEKISEISDEFFKNLFISFEKDVKSGNIVKIIRDISSLIPGVFLAIPFFTSIWHTMGGREITEKFREKLDINADRKKRYLWLSDTIDDMNGVAGSVRNIGWYSYIHGIDVSIGIISDKEDNAAGYPPKIVKIPSVYSFPLPYYDNLTIQVPSVLKAIEIIYEYNPDEIYISTPGPLGLIGLLASKLLNIPVSGIYHTDFSSQFFQLTGNSDLARMVESYNHWFYSQMTDIKVPTIQYAQKLKERGYSQDKICRYYKALDTSLFAPIADNDALKRKLRIDENDIILFYAGRISADKNIDFLLDLFSEISGSNPNLRLILAGTGPDLNEYRKKTRNMPRISFPGSIKREELPSFYSLSHLLVFPSITDTFGMVVLEAQACCLPAVVSDTGGQTEIIKDEVTGLTAKANDINDWKEKISRMIEIIQTRPDIYEKMKADSRARAVKLFSWEKVIYKLFSRKQIFRQPKENLKSRLQENYLLDIFQKTAV